METELRTQAEVAVTTIRERLAALPTIDVDSGPLEGSTVVQLDALRGLADGAIPESSRFAADVRTPGRVVVTAVCPRCSTSALITVLVSSELRVDLSGAELRVKGSSKAAPHTCGQTTLEDPDGQMGAFDIGDLVEDDSPTASLRRLLLDVGYTVPVEVADAWSLEQQTVAATYAAFLTEAPDGVSMDEPELLADYRSPDEAAGDEAEASDE